MYLETARHLHLGKTRHIHSLENLFWEITCKLISQYNFNLVTTLFSYPAEVHVNKIMCRSARVTTNIAEGLVMGTGNNVTPIAAYETEFGTGDQCQRLLIPCIILPGARGGGGRIWIVLLGYGNYGIGSDIGWKRWRIH
ncbi:hypothetical protein HAX54_021750 [Datura stramonium]|uniref:Uncharacterized protein n=1 Tax=Datura stramonium TaxID=4076 RepID=A0ABS8S700_DATST|nr:hypothetical protein [Datura stramonium]